MILILKCNDSFTTEVTLFRTPAGLNLHPRKLTRALCAVPNKPNRREEEIRRKIMILKKAGRIKEQDGADATSADSNRSSDFEVESKLDKLRRERQSMRDNPVMDEYADKIKSQLGSREKNIGPNIIEDYDSIPDPSSENEGEEMEEKDLVNLVEKKLKEKSKLEIAAKLQQKRSLLEPDIDDVADEMEREANERKELIGKTVSSQIETRKVEQTTSGVGGSWSAGDSDDTDTYRPANGGWGYFPRPKDISKTFGGGKKIGADVKTSAEDEMRKVQDVESTRERLRQYREKVGIDVQSEKDNAQEIEEALVIGQRAMQRGVYNTAVSVLEKVTQYCSTNSKVGGQVFLELAMAYEAVGRTQEAIKIYNTLSYSRMEDVKFNAKRLLLGIEAMQFMRDEAKIDSFSRKKVKQTFIETTGLSRIADNFDKVYNTAYVDMENASFYKKLTESVVRSTREARQILLRATNSGEVPRLKVVQALRSLSRGFDEDLRDEIKRNTPKTEPVALMNGEPILSEATSDENVQYYSLMSPEQMKENMIGEWRLQLIADKKGDGVKYFNSTLSWQIIESLEQSITPSSGTEICSTFKSLSPAGFLELNQEGYIKFDDERRIISRTDVKSEGSGAIFANLMGNEVSGAPASINLAQQLVTVDSQFMLTRLALTGKKQPSVIDNVKGYYSLWRRVDTGTFTNNL